jgi:TonB-dependent receptor
MDMIPAALLDNIVVEKTFTPDKPGNFSGGSVDMTTKDMPESRILTFTSTASFNTQTTFENGVISNQSASGDWIGNSAENRDIANWLKDPSLVVPNRITAAFARDSLGNVDSTKALQLNKVAKAVNTKMTPDRRTAPLNQSYGLSYGDQLEFFGKPLGFVSSLTYSRSHSYYNNGSIGQRYYTPSDDTLYQHNNYTDEYGKEEVLWGGLINSSYRIHPNHKIGFTYMYNRNSESSARYIEGWNYNSGAGATYRSRTLSYNERVLNAVQFKGEHAKLPVNARFDWQFSATTTSSDEPDLRSFADDSTLYIDGMDTTLNFGLYQVRPSHYFRYLDEKNRELSANISLPFKQWSGQAAKFKTGAFYLHKTRNFRERQFIMDPSGTGQIRYDQFYGDADAFFGSDNFGVLDGYDNTSYIEIGNSWESYSDPKANYDGTQNVAAVYGMVELPLWSRLTMVGGVRYETTEFSMDQVYIATDTTDLIDGSDLLPSVNLICKLGENMNLRAAYGRTLARPTLRELAPYGTWEFIGGYYLSGNSHLEYTKIDNYDVRWEWFLRPGEILAVSGFVKQFYNPIERTITSNNYDIHLQNVSRAEVVGIEVEWRRQLDLISPILKNFRMGGNFSIVDSKVKLGDFELLEDRSGNPDAPDHRQLMGQSPYIVNADISYDNQKTGTHATLLYNRFGKRLSEVSQGATPDIFEAPRTTVDLTLSQQIFTGVNFRLSGKNLTDAAYVKKYGEYKGKEEIYQQYKQGVTYSVGVSYSL